jgi:hypothetical protein
MTHEEKGALLLAKFEGKVIQRSYGGAWETVDAPFFHGLAYRIKPEPERETVTMNAFNGREYHWSASFQSTSFDTHRITFDTIDGEPDCSTIRMERLT